MTVFDGQRAGYKRRLALSPTTGQRDRQRKQETENDSRVVHAVVITASFASRIRNRLADRRCTVRKRLAIHNRGECPAANSCCEENQQPITTWLRHGLDRLSFQRCSEVGRQRQEVFEPHVRITGKVAVSPVTGVAVQSVNCLLYTSPSPRDQRGSRMPSSA